MYPIDVPALMRRHLCGMSAADPVLPNTPSRRRRLAAFLRSGWHRRAERPSTSEARPLGPDQARAATSRALPKAASGGSA